METKSRKENQERINKLTEQQARIALLHLTENAYDTSIAMAAKIGDALDIAETYPVPQEVK